MAILPNLQQQNDELKAQLAAMAAKLIEAQKPKAMTLKVSEKGALSIYGLGRFPVTLYLTQIERILGHADTIRAFIETNRALFATKD